MYGPALKHAFPTDGVDFEDARPKPHEIRLRVDQTPPTEHLADVVRQILKFPFRHRFGDYATSRAKSRYEQVWSQTIGWSRVQHAGRPYRVLFAFDPKRCAILLTGGDKTGNERWYEEFVPIADRLYEEHLIALEKEKKNNG